MAKSTKNSRNIVVNDVAYRWRATGNDGGMSLTIWPADLPGATISCGFDYGQERVPVGPGHWRLENQIVVTARIVRRVIEYAIATHGYDAARPASQLNLWDLDGAIEMSDVLRSNNPRAADGREQDC